MIGDTRRLAKRLGKHLDHIFTLLDCDDVPFDNNFAGHQIRPAVILRKNSQSNRSNRRGTTPCVLMTVCSTLRQRGSNSTKTIANALRTYLETGE